MIVIARPEIAVRVPSDHIQRRFLGKKGMQATARNIPTHAWPQRKHAIRGTTFTCPMQNDPDPRRGMGMRCLVGMRRNVQMIQTRLTYAGRTNQ